jgi:uncharacterized membrane-anchored protein
LPQKGTKEKNQTRIKKGIYFVEVWGFGDKMD